MQASPAPATPAEAPPTPSSTDTSAAPQAPPAPDSTDTSAGAEAEISPETKEALAVDQFVNYLKKQESVLGKLKKAMLAINLSLKDAEPDDKINFFKMLKLTASKQLDIPAKKTK
jgi:hypothetical protein